MLKVCSGLLPSGSTCVTGMDAVGVRSPIRTIVNCAYQRARADRVHGVQERHSISTCYISLHTAYGFLYSMCITHAIARARARERREGMRSA